MALYETNKLKKIVEELTVRLQTAEAQLAETLDKLDQEQAKYERCIATFNNTIQVQIRACMEQLREEFRRELEGRIRLLESRMSL